MESIECYRCAARIGADQFDRERWLALDAWSCSMLLVCRVARCRTSAR
jgi:hypothetical protein